jgi:hypothetical protein
LESGHVLSACCITFAAAPSWAVRATIRRLSTR